MMKFLQLHGLLPANALHQNIAPEHCLFNCGEVNAITSVLASITAFEELNEVELREWARQHNAILQAYCTSYPVLPTAPGAVFSSSEALIAEVASRSDVYLRSLKSLTALREFVVQIMPKRSAPKQPEADHTGRQYLARKQQNRRRRGQFAASRNGIVTQITNELRDLTVHCDPAFSHAPTYPFAAAILVATENMPDLRQLLTTFGPAAAALDLSFTITGPTPAYSFVPSDHLEARHAC